MKGYDISVGVREGAVGVDNDSELQNLVAEPDGGEGLLDIASYLRYRHQNKYGRTFDVSKGSIAFEILAHVIPGEMARALIRAAEEYLPSSVADDVIDLLNDNVLRRTNVVDIGENDGWQRVVFDAFGSYIDLIDFIDEFLD